MLTLQSPSIFRELGLSTLKRVTKLAKAAGIPTMVHSCGKEKELVKICAEENIFKMVEVAKTYGKY